MVALRNFLTVLVYGVLGVETDDMSKKGRRRRRKNKNKSKKKNKKKNKIKKDLSPRIFMSEGLKEELEHSNVTSK